MELFQSISAIRFPHSLEKFTSEGLTFGLRKGYIALLLDGFDEISKARQPIIEREIHEIIASAPKCKMLLSGRPHARYHSWHSVSEAQIENLDLDQILELVNHITFDEGRKTEFSAQIRNKLYKSHRKLLANPLLCCLMLMTFDEFSEIPASMHVYYRKAFEVLLRKHDSLKPQYVREFNTQLSEERITRVFETFCYLSFVLSTFTFSRVEILEILESAIEYEQFDVTSKMLLDDLVDNVCILLNEGDEYAFIHRSFQEYFAAVFLSGRKHNNMLDLVNEISGSLLYAEVLNFMAEMKPEVLERGYLIPALEKILNYIGDIEPSLKFFSIFDGVLVYEDSSVSPIASLKTSMEWLGGGMVAIRRISGERLKLPSPNSELTANLLKRHRPRTVAGKQAVELRRDTVDCADLVRHLKYGQELEAYLRAVQQRATEKERKRERTLSRIRSGLR